MTREKEYGIPTIDLAQWRSAAPEELKVLAGEIDRALRQVGIFRLRGHGVSVESREEVRRVVRPFFSLPVEEKEKYGLAHGSNGWRGRVTTSSLYGEEGPPDLHEVFLAGPQHTTGDATLDAIHYPVNIWPQGSPLLQPVASRYAEQMERTSQDVLQLLATLVDLPNDYFVQHTDRATWTLSMNWYPSLRAIGSVLPGQQRVAPHSDFGTVSLLDRQVGVGGLQVWHEELGWLDPPDDPESLLVILGDLMHVWTDGRWNPARHRVLAPSTRAPDEELMSLVFFYEANPDAVVKPLAAPAGGGRRLAPVVAGEWMREKIGILNNQS